MRSDRTTWSSQLWEMRLKDHFTLTFTSSASSLRPFIPRCVEHLDLVVCILLMHLSSCILKTCPSPLIGWSQSWSSVRIYGQETRYLSIPLKEWPHLTSAVRDLLSLQPQMRFVLPPWRGTSGHLGDADGYPPGDTPNPGRVQLSSP